MNTNKMTNRIVGCILLSLFSPLLFAVPPWDAMTPWDPVSHSCGEYANYADELEDTGFSIVSQLDAGGKLVDVEITTTLKNNDTGRFDEARLSADFAAAGFHPTRAPQPMSFGPIDPTGIAQPTANLQLRLSADEVTDLLARLNAGDIPLTINASERAQLPDDVRIFYWDQNLEAAFNDWWQHNPFGEFAQPKRFFKDEHFMAGDIHLNERVFLIVNKDFYVPDVPKDIWNVGFIGRYEPAAGGIAGSLAMYINTSAFVHPALEDLTDVVASGSFCIPRTSLLDPPVQATRLIEIDGKTPSDEERDRNGQPLRFNDLDFGGILLSGQVSAQVLRPNLQVRVRRGRIKINSDFDTHLSMAASLRAEETRSVDEELELFHFCFPLPEFNIGPFLFHPNITLTQQLGLDAKLTAGVQMGFEKSFHSTQSIGYDPERDQPYYASSRFDQTPLNVTPPRLTDDSRARARVSTGARAAINLELISTYPNCQNGLGAYVNIQAGADFRVDPHAESWWTLQPALRIGGGIGLDFFGIQASHDVESQNYLDAQIAQAPAAPAAINSVTQGARQSGEDQRWAIATQLPGEEAFSRRIEVEHADVAATDDGVVAVSHAGNLSAYDHLYKWDRYGALQWMKSYRSAQDPLRVLPQADSSLLVAGSKISSAGIWLVRHDRDGGVLWSKKYRVLDPDSDPVYHCVLTDIIDFESDGEVHYLAVGVRGDAVLRESDGCIVRLTGDGNVLWARIYEDLDMLNFYAVSATRDGHFIVAGESGAGPEPFGANVSNPFVMKIDPEGVVQWSKSLPMNNRGGMFLSAVEGSDGRYYMAGSGSGDIRTTGSLLVARIDSDGGDPRHAILFHDVIWENQLDNAWANMASHTPWVAPESLSGTYDHAFDMTAVGDSIVVAGNTAAGPNTTAWVIRLNQNLGVNWHAFFDGGGNDTLYSIADTGDGLLVAGRSNAMLGNYPSLLTMKLPYEGHIELPAESGLLSRYAEPGAFDSSADPDIVVVDIDWDINLTVQDATVEQTDGISDLLSEDQPLCVDLLTTGTFQSGHVSSNDACSQ